MKFIPYSRLRKSGLTRDDCTYEKLCVSYKKNRRFESVERIGTLKSDIAQYLEYIPENFGIISKISFKS